MTEKIKIPVIVLSGFLGSGKTTLLNRLLRESLERHLKPAVLMNELGKLDVDGIWLNSQFTQLALEKLIDGCICCSKKSEIPFAIKTLLNKRPDVLFIELTGVANPEEIADAVADPALVDFIQLHSIINVIDAEHVLEYNSIFHSDKALIRTLRRQMEVADLLVVNKISLVMSSKSAKIAKLLHKHNPNARVEYTNHSQISLERVFERLQQIPDEWYPVTIKRTAFNVLRNLSEEIPVGQSELTVDQSFTRLKTVSFRIAPSRIPSKEQIEHFIREQNRVTGQQLLRAKGFINGSILHYAGKHMVWQPSDYSGESYLVLIGLELDVDRLMQEWASLVM